MCSYDGLLAKMLVLIAVVACSKSDDKKSAGADPWATPTVGGPYAGFIGEVGSNSSGAYIHFGEKPSEAPTANMRFNDHICYRN